MSVRVVTPAKLDDALHGLRGGYVVFGKPMRKLGNIMDFAGKLDSWNYDVIVEHNPAYGYQIYHSVTKKPEIKGKFGAGKKKTGIKKRRSIK